MSIRKKLIILIIGCLLLNACGSNGNHEKDLDYIFIITKNLNRISDNADGLIVQLIKETKIMAQDRSRKLSDSSAEVYIKLSEESISLLYSSINALSGLSERDDSINVKKYCL